MSNRIVIKNTLVDGYIIQSIMNFPTNKHLRDSWQAIHFARASLGSPAENNTSQVGGDEVLCALIDAPAFSQLQINVAESTRKGVVVGDILASLYLMHLLELPDCSLSRAIQVSSKLAKSSEYGAGPETPYSERTIKTYIKEFASVAHLWAAFRISAHFSFANSTQDSAKSLAKFLVLSETCYQFGCSFVPHGAQYKYPIIKTEDAWVLPEGTSPSELTMDDFPDIMLDFVRGKDITALTNSFILGRVYSQCQ